MTTNLTVLEIHELNGVDEWYDYPPEYYYVTGHSCLTPEGEIWNIKQYKLLMQDVEGQTIYAVYALSCESMSRYYFDLPRGFSDDTLDHIPRVGETFSVQSRFLHSTKAQDMSYKHTQLRLVPKDYCCIPDGDNGCYCYREAEMPFTPVGLHVVRL